MSKHEIRLRRQKMTSHGADRFRNYGAIMERHENEKRVKKLVRVFGYFIVIAILVVLIVIVTRVEKKVSQPGGSSTIQLFNGSTFEGKV